MTWWLFTEGNCVWGTGQVDDLVMEGQEGLPHQVQSLRGHIGSDFTITGEILWHGPRPPMVPIPFERYSPLEMRIEFDDAGAILLREDREAGVRGLRCPEPAGYCPDPLYLELTAPL